MEKLITLVPVDQEYHNFMSLEPGPMKNVKYFNNIENRHFAESSVLYKDGGVMHYAYTTFKVRKSKSGYYRQNVIKDGFTFSNGKVKPWFGKNIFQIPNIKELYKHLNFNWLNDKLEGYITKSILEKMLTGKITNNLDLVKAYVRVMKLKCSYKFLYSVIINTSNSKPYILRLMSVAKDQDHLLKYLMTSANDDTFNPVIYDIVKQAMILDKKIDFNWSIKRMEEEHNKWTNELMDIEIKNMEDETAINTIPYLEFKYPGFKLLTTKKEVYIEGKTMNHCVYTNYWSEILNGRYLVYHISHNNEEATLGLSIQKDKIVFNQCTSKRNSSISEELRDICYKFLDRLNEFDKRNNILKPECELVYL